MLEIINLSIVLFNFLSVYYAAKNNIWTWIYGIFASLLTAFLFYTDTMIMSMLFNIFSALMCVLGLLCWNKNSKKNDESITTSNTFITFILTLFLFCGIFIVNVFCQSKNLWFDTLGTTLAITATFLLIEQDYKAWYYWICCDICYIVMATIKYDYKYLIIYGVMLLLAINGLIRNKTLYNINKQKI